jgi:hypothetical protein
MRNTSPKRMRTRLLIPAFALATVVGLSACSKSDSETTDVATTEAATSEAAASEAPATEAPATEAAATEAPLTEAAVASTDAAPVTEASAPDTGAAASEAGAASGEALKATLIGQVLSGFSGGGPADPKDVTCVNDKVTEKDVTAIMSAAPAGGGTPPEALPVMKAIFACKPKGLMESFVKDTFNDLPADVTEEQKSCVAGKLFDFIASDDEILNAMVADAAEPPESFRAEGIKIVTGCLPAGASRDKMIEQIKTT